MDEELQVKPTNAERLLWEFPGCAAFTLAAWVLADHVSESFSFLMVMTCVLSGAEFGKRLALRAAKRRWDREAISALNRAATPDPDAP